MRSRCLSLVEVAQSGFGVTRYKGSQYLTFTFSQDALDTLKRGPHVTHARVCFWLLPSPECREADVRFTAQLTDREPNSIRPPNNFIYGMVVFHK